MHSGQESSRLVEPIEPLYTTVHIHIERRKSSGSNFSSQCTLAASPFLVPTTRRFTAAPSRRPPCRAHQGAGSRRWTRAHRRPGRRVRTPCGADRRRGGWPPPETASGDHHPARGDEGREVGDVAHFAEGCRGRSRRAAGPGRARPRRSWRASRPPRPSIPAGRSPPRRGPPGRRARCRPGLSRGRSPPAASRASSRRRTSNTHWPSSGRPTQRAHSAELWSGAWPTWSDGTASGPWRGGRGSRGTSRPCGARRPAGSRTPPRPRRGRGGRPGARWPPFQARPWPRAAGPAPARTGRRGRSPSGSARGETRGTSGNPPSVVTSAARRRSASAFQAAGSDAYVLRGESASAPRPRRYFGRVTKSSGRVSPGKQRRASGSSVSMAGSAIGEPSPSPLRWRVIQPYTASRIACCSRGPTRRRHDAGSRGDPYRL